MGIRRSLGFKKAAKNPERVELHVVETLAFRFQCLCGEWVVCPVPEVVGTTVVVKCHGGCENRLVWKGDHFGMTTTNPESINENFGVAFIAPTEQMEGGFMDPAALAVGGLREVMTGDDLGDTELDLERE
jgi:hypothetical protein